MMLHKRTRKILNAGLSALLSAIVLALPLCPVRAAETEQAVRDALKDISRTSLDNAWDKADDIVAQGKPQVISKIVLEYVPNAQPFELLIIGRVFSLLENTEQAFSVFAALARDEKAPVEIRKAACRALFTSADLVGKLVETDLLEEMLDSPEPALRLAAADSMLRFHGSERAVAVLMPLAARSDEIGDDAALSLAENGYLNWVRSRIRRIARRPTERGRRALNLVLDQQDEAQFPGNTLLEEIYKNIRNYYVDWEEIENDELITHTARGMVEALDAFSSYLSEEDVKDMEESLTGRYGGIGAYVGMHNEVFTIISPIYNGPAYKVGLRSMDKVFEVGEEKTSDLRFMEVVKRLRGEPNTEVEVKIYRTGWPEPRTFTIKREEITIESVLYAMLPGNIGYIRLTRFGDTTTSECRDALKELKKDGANAFIVDLRNNGGGLLDAAVSTADLFLESDRLIVYSVGRPTTTPRRNFYSSREPLVDGKPLVVLVNTGSASASEILAGTLQDWKKAVLVGEKTYGKGSVQTLLDLNSTGGKTKLRLTIAKYYLPTQRTIHEKGVEPDVAIEEEDYPIWKTDALVGIEEKVEEFVRKLVKEKPELCRECAVYDAHTIESYPGLNELIDSVEDPRLEAEDIRRYVRSVIRRRIADIRGKAFVADIEEDRQLRRGILEVLMQLDLADGKLPPEYRDLAEEFPEAFEKTVASTAGQDGEDKKLAVRDDNGSKQGKEASEAVPVAK